MTEQPETQNRPEEKERQKGSRRRIVGLIALAIVAASVYLIWRLFFATPSLPPNVIALSGRVEGDDSAISPKTSGRILEIRFREGDSVKAGEVIAVLSDEQIRAREDQARAAVFVAEASSKSARDQIAVLDQQMQQNQLQTAQSKVDAEGRVRYLSGW
jgi:HlyD family secretion protein